MHTTHTMAELIAHDHGGRADSHDSGTDNDHHNKAEHKHADGKDAGKQDRKGHSHSNDASNDAKVQPNVGILASGGASFSLASAVVPGKVVAIDFWAEWCKPCKGIEATLVAHASTHPKTGGSQSRSANPKVKRRRGALRRKGQNCQPSGSSTIVAWSLRSSKA